MYLCKNTHSGAMKALDNDLLNSDLTERLRSAKHCREAFTEVINIYSQPLYRQIRRLVPTHADADDVLQNTFLKAWSNLEYFRGDAKLSTWLYRIAINESISFLARERKHKNLSIDDQEAALINAIAADEYVDGDETARMLREAIATLPEKQRIVFNLKYFDELKYEEMSDILATSVGALKASYHLAVKKIERFFTSKNIF